MHVSKSSIKESPLPTSGTDATFPLGHCAPSRYVPFSLPAEVTADLNNLDLIPLLFFLFLHVCIWIDAHTYTHSLLKSSCVYSAVTFLGQRCFRSFIRGSVHRLLPRLCYCTFTSLGVIPAGTVCAVGSFGVLQVLAVRCAHGTFCKIPSRTCCLWFLHPWHRHGAAAHPGLLGVSLCRHPARGRTGAFP